MVTEILLMVTIIIICSKVVLVEILLMVTIVIASVVR